MKNIQEKRDNYIKRLTQTTQTIKNLYNELTKAANNPEKEKEIKEYLDLAISVEDKIYKEIGEKVLCEDQFLNRTKYLIHKSDLSDKDQIYTRILLYATQKIFLNPFPSTEPRKEDRTDENIASIKCQVCMEYIKNIITNTQNEIDNSVKKNERKKLINSKNNTLFNNKLMSSLINNKKYCNSSSRKRCLEFKHDEKSVNSIYMEYAGSIINYSLNNILVKEESIFNQIELRSALQLLNENEIFNIARNYQKIIDDNPYYQILPGSQIIFKIIGD